MAVDPKVERLERAFGKALQGLDQGIGDADIQECFGDLKLSLGAALQRGVMNMMSRTVEKMSKNFDEINESFDLKHQINNYNTHTPSQRRTESNPAAEVEDQLATERQLKEVYIALKRAEIEELTRSMRALEGEIKKSKEQAGRLKTQLMNEVDALEIEKMKIKYACEVLGNR